MEDVQIELFLLLEDEMNGRKKMMKIEQKTMKTAKFSL
jgi:hypothetical protein